MIKSKYIWQAYILQFCKIHIDSIWRRNVSKYNYSSFIKKYIWTLKRRKGECKVSSSALVTDNFWNILFDFVGLYLMKFFPKSFESNFEKRHFEFDCTIGSTPCSLSTLFNIRSYNQQIFNAPTNERYAKI